MPRAPQTGYGSRKHSQSTSVSFLPPVRHISVQYPGINAICAASQCKKNITFAEEIMQAVEYLCQIYLHNL